MKKKRFRISRFILLQVSNDHMFYKYDLTLRLFGYTILLMWLPTTNGRVYRENFGSFSVYTRRYRKIYHKRFGKVGRLNLKG